MKKLPLWLKYGLITSLFATFTYLISISIFKFPLPLLPEAIRLLIFIVFFLFLNYIIFAFLLGSLEKVLPFNLIESGEYYVQTPIGATIGILIWLLIGAMIGYIVQKRRDKNEK